MNAQQLAEVRRLVAHIAEETATMNRTRQGGSEPNDDDYKWAAQRREQMENTLAGYVPLLLADLDNLVKVAYQAVLNLPFSPTQVALGKALAPFIPDIDLWIEGD